MYSQKQKNFAYTQDRVEVLHEFNKDYMPLIYYDKPYLSVKPGDAVRIINTASEQYPAALAPLSPISRRRTWVYASKDGTSDVGFVPSTYLNIQYMDCIFGPDAMDIHDVVYEHKRCCPLFLDQAFQLYEYFGKVYGIFRESPPLAEKNYMMEQINRKRDHSLLLALLDFYQTQERRPIDSKLNLKQVGDYLKNSTLHIIASLIKQFFGDLPNKLIQKHLIDLLAGMEDLEAEKCGYYAALLEKHLEFEEFLVLRYLLQFLYRMSQYGATTKMEADYLGQLFSPNLLEEDNPAIMSYLIKNQIRLEGAWDRKCPLPKPGDNPLYVQWRDQFMWYNLNKSAVVIKDFQTTDPYMLSARAGDDMQIISVHKRWVFGRIDQTKGWIPLMCVKIAKKV